MSGDDASVPVNERNLGVLNLSRSGGSPQLKRRLDHMVHGPKVCLGQETAVSVHGEVFPDLHASFERERAALPFRDEAQAFKLEEHGYREAVVEKRDIDVLGTDAGRLERPLAGAFYGVVDLVEVAERGEVLV